MAEGPTGARVIDLPRLPEGLAQGEVGHALSDAIPSIYVYALSFFVIGQFWLAHHRLFRFIRAADRRLAVINLVFLGTMAFLPYPTSVLGEYGNGTTATVFYAVCIALAGLAELWLWLYAVRIRTLALPGFPGAGGGGREGRRLQRARLGRRVRRQRVQPFLVDLVGQGRQAGAG
jgi:hypothetical protein